MEGVKIERAGSLPRCTLGEGPHWDQESESLLYVDIPNHSVFRYYPATDRVQKLDIGEY